MKLVDLSTLIEDNERSPVDRCGIDYQDHAAGSQRVEEMLGVPSRLMRNGEGWAVENFTYLNT